MTIQKVNDSGFSGPGAPILTFWLKAVSTLAEVPENYRKDNHMSAMTAADVSLASGETEYLVDGLPYIGFSYVSTADSISPYKIEAYYDSACEKEIDGRFYGYVSNFMISAATEEGLKEALAVMQSFDMNLPYEFEGDE